MGGIGFTLVLVGLVGAAIYAWQAFRAASVGGAHAATPTSSIARAPRGAVVELAGVVVPDEGGTILSPVTGTRAVVLDVEVTDVEASARTAHRQTDRRDFWLDDGSGVRARIAPAGATVSGTSRYVEDLASLPAERGVRLQRFPPQAVAWLASVAPGVAPRHLVVDETVVAAGQRILALGHAATGPDGALVLRRQEGAPFSLSVLAEEELVGLHAQRRKVGTQLFAFCVGLVALGAGLGAWSLWG